MAEPDAGTLTPQQVAELLQVEPQTIWRMIRRGELPAIKVGRVYRITRTDFDEWCELNKRRGKEH